MGNDLQAPAATGAPERESAQHATSNTCIGLQGGTSEGNKVILHNSGTSAFSEMWNAINHAKHRVDMETYILVPDAVGLKTLECLTEAAKRGCKYVFWGLALSL